MKLSRIVIRLILIVVVGIVALAPGVYADTVSVGQHIYFQFAYGNEDRPNDGINGRGGAFGVYDFNSKNFLFNSFCLETNEYINLSTRYHVGSISGVVTYNGYDSNKGYLGTYPNGGDPLDSRTAYLFTNFWHGTLSGYVNGQDISADALQRAIWFIEQEYGNTKPGDKGNPPTSTDLDKYLGTDQTGLLAKQFFNLANQNANGSLYDVQVMNVIDGNLQSMLVCVPEPGILILLGIAMSAIGAASWRIRKL